MDQKELVSLTNQPKGMNRKLSELFGGNSISKAKAQLQKARTGKLRRDDVPDEALLAYRQVAINVLKNPAKAKPKAIDLQLTRALIADTLLVRSGALTIASGILANPATFDAEAWDYYNSKIQEQNIVE